MIPGRKWSCDCVKTVERDDSRDESTQRYIFINPSVTILFWSPPDHGIIRVGQEESHRHDTQVVLNILEREELKQSHFLPLGTACSFFFLSLDTLSSFCDCLQCQHAKMEGKLSHLHVYLGKWWRRGDRALARGLFCPRNRS